MKARSLLELIEASEERHEGLGWGKFLLGCATGAALSLFSVYFISNRNESAAPGANLAAAADNSAEKKLLDELNRSRQAEAGYKKIIAEKDAALAEANKTKSGPEPR